MRLLKPGSLAWVLLAILPVVFLLGLMTGPVSIPLHDMPAFLFGNSRSAVTSQQSLILYDIRLPRLLLAALVGAALASCGAVLQGLFRNPLADPSLIGVSSGASAGASCAIVLGATLVQGTTWYGLSVVTLGAFAGGLLASVLVYRLASGPDGTSVATMLLVGIAISALAGAINSLFSFFADNDMLRRISLWQMGSLDSASWPQVSLLALVTLLILAWLPSESRALNAMLLGESEARHLGIEVEWLKRRLIVLTALGIGVSVAVAGTVAFVGLVVPHLVRLLIGPDYRFLTLTSAALGAILLMSADTVARMVVAPAELPVGVITALLGAPFFVVLLVRQQRVV